MDVANGIAVQVAGLTLTGLTHDGTAASVDYTVTQPTTSANITQATLSVTGILAMNKIYDGTTTATLNTSNAALQGTVSGDTGITFSTSAAVGAFVSKDVANGITVNISGITFGGTTQDSTAASVDYTLVQPTTTANITPLALLVTATGISKGYDTTTSATVTLSDNRLAIDDGTFTDEYTSAAFTDPNVGNNKTVNVSGIFLSGPDSQDYTPNTTASTTANITIGTPVISVTGGPFVYNDTAEAATVTVTDGHGNEVAGTITVTYTAAPTNQGSSSGAVTDVGMYYVGVEFVSSNPNYMSLGTVTPVDAGTLTITPATLTVSGVTGMNKVYDGTTSATVNTAGATLNGVYPSDNVTLTGTGGTFSSPDVGNNLTVTASGLSLIGSNAFDYVLTVPTTTANITQATLTVTGITALNKTYDGTTTASLSTSGATLNGTAAGDTGITFSAASATGAFATRDVANGIVVQVSGITFGGITQDSTPASVDYVLTQPTTTANITQATLTVTGITAANKTYDGTTTASLTTSGATLHGTVSGDTGITFAPPAPPAPSLRPTRHPVSWCRCRGSPSAAPPRTAPRPAWTTR